MVAVGAVGAVNVAVLGALVALERELRPVVDVSLALEAHVDSLFGLLLARDDVPRGGAESRSRARVSRAGPELLRIGWQKEICQ